FTLDQSTYWTNASQATSGAPGGPQLTDTSTYDFNTSKETGMIDPNGLGATYQYDGNLRPQLANLPTGETVSTAFSDGSMSVSVSLSYTDGATTKTPTGTNYTNGWGWITQTADQAGNLVNYAYDSMGRRQSRTNPFPQGGTPGPITSYSYDSLGRL